MARVAYQREGGKSLENLKACVMVGVDKDGVLVDDSRLLHENRSRGFEANGLEFPYSVRTNYMLGGISHAYHGGTRPITALIAFEKELKRNGHSAGTSKEAELLKIILRDGADMVFDGLIERHVGEAERELAKRIYWWDGGRFFNSDEAGEYVVPVPGAREAVLELMDTLMGNVAVVTNAHSAKIALRDLRACGFSEREISSIVMEVAAKKPSPEGIHKARLRLEERSGKDIPRHSVAFAGDAAIDITTAIKAGAVPVGLLSGMGRRKHFILSGAQVVVEDISALAAVLRRDHGSQ